MYIYLKHPNLQNSSGQHQTLRYLQKNKKTTDFDWKPRVLFSNPYFSHTQPVPNSCWTRTLPAICRYRVNRLNTKDSINEDDIGVRNKIWLCTYAWSHVVYIEGEVRPCQVSWLWAATFNVMYVHLMWCTCDVWAPSLVLCLPSYVC